MNSQTLAHQLATTERRLSALHRKAQRLREQLDQARRVEAQGAQAREVFARFNAGDYVAALTSGPWWCNDGELLRPLSTDEATALYHLRDAGIVTKD